MSVTTASLAVPRRRRPLASLAGRVVRVAAVPVVLVALWWFFSASSTSFYFPPLSAIVGAFDSTWMQGRIVADVLPSLTRLLAGYGAALVVGIAAGVLIGLSDRLRAFLEPTLEFFRAIPPPVLVPVLMLFLGIFDTMKIVVIAVGCVWPVLINTIEGVRGTDEVLRDTSRIYRLRPGALLTTLYLRSASPQILTGARQSLSIGIILMVVSEMFAANNGLGFAIIQFQRTFAIPQMWSGILLLGVIGVVLALLFRLVERPLLAWHRGLNRSEQGS